MSSWQGGRINAILDKALTRQNIKRNCIFHGQIYTGRYHCGPARRSFGYRSAVPSLLTRFPRPRISPNTVVTVGNLRTVETAGLCAAIFSASPTVTRGYAPPRVSRDNGGEKLGTYRTGKSTAYNTCENPARRRKSFERRVARCIFKVSTLTPNRGVATFLDDVP